LSTNNITENSKIMTPQTLMIPVQPAWYSSQPDPGEARARAEKTIKSLAD
jgi:hypothetical protein